MTLTSPPTEPFYISTFEWNAALDLAGHRQEGMLRYGWDRTEKRANFHEAFSGVDEHLLSVIGQLKDDFSFGWGQAMSAQDVQTLTAALQQARNEEGEIPPDFLPQLLAFLEHCAQSGQEVRLEP